MTEVALTPSPTSVDKSGLTDGQTADAGDVRTPIEDLETAVDAARAQVAVSADDTHVGQLEDKLSATAPLQWTTTNPAGNETLNLGFDTAGVPSNYVYTPAGWAAPGGGGATPIDLSITAGENLAERDVVFLDTSDNEWYKLDIDADPIKCGELRAVVNETGGITSGNSGSARVLGEVSGFSGLSIYRPVYASATPGGVTQTKPQPTLGGNQVAIAQIGFATSATSVMVNMSIPVTFSKRATVANGGTMTVDHYRDAAAQTRRALANVSATEPGDSMASHTDSFRDNREFLRTTTGSGGTVTPNNSATLSTYVGNHAGTHYTMAQSFMPASGTITAFTVSFKATVGNPFGGVNWSIRTDSAGKPSATILASGNFTPVASSNNSITVNDGVYLDGSTTYWLVLDTQNQASNNYYQVQYSGTSTYANGQMIWDTDRTLTWEHGVGGGYEYELRCSITTTAVTERAQLAQSIQVASSDSAVRVRLYLRKIGSPAGTLTVRLETDSAGSPSGSLVTGNATITVAESALSTAFTWIDFDFPAAVPLASGTTYWIVLSTSRSASNTHYVEWGVDKTAPAYASGSMRGYIASTWTALNADAIFDIVGEATSYEGPTLVGFWTYTFAPVVVRYDDGVGANGETKTTFKNRSGASVDLTCSVRLK